MDVVTRDWMSPGYDVRDSVLGDRGDTGSNSIMQATLTVILFALAVFFFHCCCHIPSTMVMAVTWLNSF